MKRRLDMLLKCLITISAFTSTRIATAFLPTQHKSSCVRRNTGRARSQNKQSSKLHVHQRQQQQHLNQQRSEDAAGSNGGVNFEGYWPPASANSNYNTNTNNIRPPQMPPVEPDEYDVIVLYPSTDVPFLIEETDMGEPAFAGYIDGVACSTIKSIGDVIVAIDGATTQGSTMDEIIRFIQEKARTNPYSFFRFRESFQSSSAQNAGKLPGEKQRARIEGELILLERQLRAKEEEIANIKQIMEAKRQELQLLKRTDLEWINQKWGELDYQI